MWLTAMLLAAIIGGLLVITADDDGVDLEAVITGEGLATRIPEGWEPVEDRPFEFVPAGTGDRSIERWVVARACGPDGCEPRSLDEWLMVGERLPTFVTALDDEGDLLFAVTDEWTDDARILRAETAAGARQVFVAAFIDGADFYVECAATQFGDRDLVDAIVDVCRSTEPAG